MRESFSEFLNLVKSKNDITDVIGSYIKLERKGYNYWACCPFHHEKTPSFSVNAGDRYYHCFGCGVSGDVITFIKEYENVEFMQAVRILSDRAGLEIPVFDERESEELALKKQKKDRLRALMKDAARFYLNNLYSGNANVHLEYLTKRGIAPSTMKKFGLGASTDFYSLPSYLRANGYTAEECVESGACAQAEDGKIIDAMGGRLIIPIIDALGDVIAFGGRLLKKSDRAKYKNTRDSELFEKNNNLFNINLVKKEKRAGGVPYIILVEGYMDVISLYQAGFRSVGASMGTSLTKNQARLIKRYTDTVLISYDGDAAGQNANLRGLDILKREGLKVKVVPLPEGLDPDDLIRERGAEGYSACLENAMPLIDFRILCVRRKYDMQKTEERRDFVREALPIVKEAESETEKEELLKRISEISGVSITALSADLENVTVAEEKEPRQKPPPQRDADREEKAADFVLCACLFSKPYTESFDPKEFAFEGDRKRIADYIVKSRSKGRVQPSGIFDELGSDSKELSAVLNVDSGDNLDGESAEKYFSDCVRTLRKKQLNVRLAAAKENGDTNEISEIFKELKRL